MGRNGPAYKTSSSRGSNYVVPSLPEQPAEGKKNSLKDVKVEKVLKHAASRQSLGTAASTSGSGVIPE